MCEWSLGLRLRGVLEEDAAVVAARGDVLHRCVVDLGYELVLKEDIFHRGVVNVVISI